MVYVVGCTKKNANQASNNAASQSRVAQRMEPPKPLPQVKKEDVVIGKGKEAVPGKMISVHYTGRLAGGKEFDSSVKRKLPFRFKLGAGQVITGWDKGIVGMKVGGKRKLTIPPELGYGAGGAGNVIPPNATLNFDVELLGVE